MNKPKLWHYFLGAAIFTTIIMLMMVVGSIKLNTTHSLVTLKTLQVTLIMYVVFGFIGFMLWVIRHDVYKGYVKETQNTFILTYLLNGKEKKSEVFPRRMYVHMPDIGEPECRMLFDFYDFYDIPDKNILPTPLYISAKDFIKLELKK